MTEFGSVNWLAVIVGAIVAFLIGWLWYSTKLFGKKWAEGSGVPLGEASEMPVFAMVTQFIALFFLALVIGLTATTDALITAIVAILAVATFTASMGAFVKKSSYAVAVDFFYVLVAGGTMIVFQGIF